MASANCAAAGAEAANIMKKATIILRINIPTKKDRRDSAAFRNTFSPRLHPSEQDLHTAQDFGAGCRGGLLRSDKKLFGRKFSLHELPNCRAIAKLFHQSNFEYRGDR